MRKVFTSAGHSNRPGQDRGAVGNGYIEGDLTVEFRELLNKELRFHNIEPISDGNDTVFKDSVVFFKNITSPDSIVIDIHWNAATPKASGVEVLIPKIHTDFERELAEKISACIGNELGISLRGKKGVKTEAESHHGRLGWMRLTGENILIEVCFITNKNDMKSYQNNKQSLAKKLAKIIHEFASKEDDKPNVGGYKVRVGDSLWKVSIKNNISINKLKRINNLESDIIFPGQVLKIK